jgi:hypothetical protein
MDPIKLIKIEDNPTDINITEFLNQNHDENKSLSTSDSDTSLDYFTQTPEEKIHTLEYREKVKTEIITYVMNCFKYDKDLDLNTKTYLTYYINLNYWALQNYEDFYEEECHLAMVNWVYEYSNTLKNAKVEENLLHLLYNIILIFEFLPFNPKDIIELKLFDKLNKIRKTMNKDLYVYPHLDRLLNTWTTICTDNPNLMGRKRNRGSFIEEQENYAEEKEFKEKEMKEKEEIIYDFDEYVNSVILNNKIIYKKENNLTRKNKTNLKSQRNQNLYKKIKKCKIFAEKKVVSWEKEENLNKIKIYNIYDEPYLVNKIKLNSNSNTNTKLYQYTKNEFTNSENENQVISIEEQDSYDEILNKIIQEENLDE